MGGGDPIYSARGQFSGYPWKVVAERAMRGTWGESGNVLCLHMSVRALVRSVCENSWRHIYLTTVHFFVCWTLL